MRIKKVNRYYCDFCKKAGCAAGHMRKHEAGCTNNPNRVCGMCRAGELSQQPMAELLACLPEKPWQADLDDPMVRPLVEKEIAAAMKELREKAQDCPACIGAALRQQGIHWWRADFNFQAACKDFWKNVNEANAVG